MITLRMESQQFVALHTGFNAAASDPDAPIDPTLITGVQSALAEAKATALPGLPVLVTLQSHNELNALHLLSRRRSNWRIDLLAFNSTTAGGL
jgi:hypothetical protein